MTLQNFKVVILLIISILIQQLHLELFGGTTLSLQALRQLSKTLTLDSFLRVLPNCGKMWPKMWPKIVASKQFLVENSV